MLSFFISSITQNNVKKNPKEKPDFEYTMPVSNLPSEQK